MVLPQGPRLGIVRNRAYLNSIEPKFSYGLGAHMRVLLDECLPRRLGNGLVGHTVKTVPQMGWASTKNGMLLQAMHGMFDVFVTMDKSLAYQQNLTTYNTLAVIALRAPSNKLAVLEPLVPEILSVLAEIGPGQFRRISVSPPQLRE